MSRVVGNSRFQAPLLLINLWFDMVSSIRESMILLLFCEVMINYVMIFLCFDLWLCFWNLLGMHEFDTIWIRL